MKCFDFKLMRFDKFYFIIVRLVLDVQNLGRLTLVSKDLRFGLDTSTWTVFGKLLSLLSQDNCNDSELSQRNNVKCSAALIRLVSFSSRL